MSISRPKPHEGFLRDFGASASRAARSSPRPGRAWRDAMCCLRGRMSYLTSRNSVRCHETLCNLLEINTTSLFLITEMVTRSALLVETSASGRLGREKSKPLSVDVKRLLQVIRSLLYDSVAQRCVRVRVRRFTS